MASVDDFTKLDGKSASEITSAISKFGHGMSSGLKNIVTKSEEAGYAKGARDRGAVVGVASAVATLIVSGIVFIIRDKAYKKKLKELNEIIEKECITESIEDIRESNKEVENE